jgi:hypothetical protein
VFATDRRIAARTQNHAPNVTTNLLASDSQLAETAVADARRSYEQLRSLGIDFDETVVRNRIQDAEESLQNGHRLRQRGAIGAFTQYEHAWTDAQRALDVMDAARSPNVTITNRVDPPHDGSVNYTVTGTVSDVRMSDFRNTTLWVNGEPRNLTLRRNTTVSGTSYFYTNITLTEQRNNITVTTTDPGTTYATNELDQTVSQTDRQSEEGRENGGQNNGRQQGGENGAQNNGGGNNADQRSSDDTSTTTSAQRQTSGDTLLLDADALPDNYERHTAETDPLNPDSNSTNTSANESNNGVIDGAEDFDDDRVSTYIEYRNGLNPFDPDTDEDRLTDWFELTYDQLDPLSADTDADGTSDDNEDFDGEGFENIREQEWGTHPHEADTDADNLTDAYEVDTTQTLPTISDSDSNRTDVNESENGLLDGAEDFDNDILRTSLEFTIDTDPFDGDTDDDRLTDLFEHTYDTITPTDPDTDGDGVRDDHEDPDNETLRNILEQEYGTHPLESDTDSDNLSDSYEVNTTATDPVVRDSDSAQTAGDEASNGIPDGSEDFDDDAVRTAVEATIETDPFDPDTDDDDLLDGFEHRYDTIEPLVADTDGDGTRDDREDPDNETLRNVLEQEYGTHPLESDTDTDNLTDAYEVNTTETNPLVPDSDSNRTQPDEAGNDVVDGTEDFDEDGLVTRLEYVAETQPFNSDTDGDDLLDGFEYTYDTIDPLDVDSDGDNISDAREDPDEDGLPNVLEQRYGTEPLDEDTDSDGLTDSFEVNATRTDPTVADSDSIATNVNESGDNVTDANEDLDGDGLTSLEEQDIGTDPLVNDTDRDLLFDGYEVQVTGADPLDPDSDSDRTETNESGNNVGDGGEDFDDDRLRTAFEQNSDLDPFSEDTDGDELTDPFEIAHRNLDPTSADTDGDGTDDAAEDPDADSLSNLDEQRVGTRPLLNDTDGDTLEDGTEVDMGTDPFAADTDSDRLNDSEERAIGTDPQSNDTDGDRRSGGSPV